MQNIDEYVEPSPRAERKRILVLFGVFMLFVIGAGAYVMFQLPDFDSLGACDRVPVLRDFYIFKIVNWLFGALILTYQAYKALAAGQYPSPSAVVFRRTRIRRGRYVTILAISYLVLAAAILFMSGFDTALMVEKLATQRAAFCT